MKLALSIQTPEIPNPLPLTLLSGSLEDKIAKAASLGVDGLEFVTILPEEVDADPIQKQLDTHRLEAAGIASGAMASVAGLTLLHTNPKIAQEAYKRLEGLIHLAARLQAPVVTIGSFRGRLGENREEQKKRFIEILRRAGELAGEQKVLLAVEPINRYEMDFILTVQEGLKFLQDVDHPAVGILVDTFHANIEESSRIEPFRKAWEVEKLFYIHIPNNNRLAPGWGLIDYPELTHSLLDMGYQGYLTAELLAQPDPDSAAEQTALIMRPLLHPAGQG